MKKRILAMLLLALIVANISACNYVLQRDFESKTDIESTSSGTNNIPMSATTGNEDIFKSNPDGAHSDSQSGATNEKSTVDFRSYDSIVSTFRKIVALCPQYETVEDEEYFEFSDANAFDLYQKIFFSALSLYPRTWRGLDGNCYNRFGFTIKDLNSDGVDELILRLDDHQVVAIFTTVNDTPMLLENFWNRNCCWIDPDGYLHISGSNGAANSVSRIYCIGEQFGTLLLIEEYGTDGWDEHTGTARFYRLLNGEKHYLSEQDLDAWKDALPYAKLDVTSNFSTYLTFVPLFDTENPAPAPYVSQTDG